jgi:tRNA threonylcarbamoyladenosine biosynthesis protein TsaE
MIKGLAAGLGYKSEVTSPTFTISRVYDLPDTRQLHHFDFYRLNSSDIVVQELAEVVAEPDAVVAIEWAANAGDVLPPERVKIIIERLSETRRQITVQAVGTRFRGLVGALA